MLRVGAVTLASFLLGMLTSYTQGVLPDAWRSFANSVSGWTLLTVLLILGARVPARLAAVLGALSFVVLVIGYTAGAQLQGLLYSPVLFGVVGLVVGPFVGVAAAWLAAQGVRAVPGTALISGIFTGEAVYGLTVIADSTRPEYWVAIRRSGSLSAGRHGEPADTWLGSGASCDPGNGSGCRSVHRSLHRPGSGLNPMVACVGGRG